MIDSETFRKLKNGQKKKKHARLYVDDVFGEINISTANIPTQRSKRILDADTRWMSYRRKTELIQIDASAQSRSITRARQYWSLCVYNGVSRGNNDVIGRAHIYHTATRSVRSTYTFSRVSDLPTYLPTPAARFP